MDNVTIDYIDSDGSKREISGLRMSVDKAGRYWLWSERLQHNLAYKAPGREACLLAAIASLLFTIQLRDERIVKLQHIADLAQRFTNEAFPPNDDNCF